jgi:hypothetical protein
MDTDYSTLRFIGSASKLIGRLVIVAGLVGFVYWLAAPFLANDAHDTSVLLVALASGLGVIVSGLIAGGAFIAVGEIIHLFINIADDTERAADAIEDAMQAKPQPGK